LLSVFAVTQFLFSPVIGNLSDRYGRRPVLLLSLFGFGIDYIILALAPRMGGYLSAGDSRRDGREFYHSHCLHCGCQYG